MRAWMISTMQRLDGHDAEDDDVGRTWWRRAVRLQLLVEDDDLRGRARAGYRALEQLVADGVGRDLGLAGDALVPRLVGTTVVIGLRELYTTREARAFDTPGAADLVPLVDRVLDFARAGVQACVPPSTS